MKNFTGILFVASVGRILGQEAPASPAMTEKLIWSAAYTYVTNSYDTAFGFYNYKLTSVAYSKGNVVLWTIHLPRRMQHYAGGSIYDKVPVNDSGITYRKATRSEIDINNSKEFLTCPELISNDLIAIADLSGFLLLDKKNGAVLIDIPGEKFYKEKFYVDEGSFTIKSKTSSYSDSLTHGAEFISVCEGYLFHFNGSELFLFNKDHRLIKRIKYNSKEHLKKSGITRREAFFHYQDFTIKITGQIFVK